MRGQRIRVVITGVGAITPIGTTVEDFWRNLVAGRSGIRPISRFDASSFPVQIGGEVSDFRPEAFMDPALVERLGLYAQFAVAAARQAADDAELKVTPANAERVAVVMNTCCGTLPVVAEATQRLLEEGPPGVTFRHMPQLGDHVLSSAVTIALGIKGPSYTTAAACAAGCYALSQACALLRLGEADVVIAGGSDALVHPLTIAGMRNVGKTGTLSQRNHEPAKACRPFDLGRDGTVLSEGAAAMVMETLESAQSRGARVYAEYLGGGISSDAFHLYRPSVDGEGAARAIRLALQDAELDPSDVDYISAHGTGTPVGDVAECRAIHASLGSHAGRVAVSATKSAVGHMNGAAGVVSSLACVLAIRDGVIPPTINLEHPDPQCNLNHVAREARRQPVRIALANGFGFGGQNAVVAFKAWDA